MIYPDLNEIYDGISCFCGKLRLTEEFFDKGMMYNKSICNSTKGRNKTLERFCDYISNFPYIELTQSEPNCNTSKRNGESSTSYKPMITSQSS